MNSATQAPSPANRFKSSASSPAEPATDASPVARVSNKESASVPQGYMIRKEARPGLITAGTIVLLIPYSLSLVAVSSSSGSSDRESDHMGWLIVPALGPWLSLAQRNCSSYKYVEDRDGCGAVNAFLLLDGLVQMAGATLITVGVAARKNVLVKKATWTVAPSHVQTGYGLIARGTF
jgi:hypothetical protein